ALPAFALDAPYQLRVPASWQLRLRHLFVERAVARAVIDNTAERVEVDRLERPHERPAQSQTVAHGLVDIIGRSVTVGVEPERLGEERTLQAIEDEALNFRAHDDRDLAYRLVQRLRSSHDVGRSPRRGRELDQRHQMRRVDRMRNDAARASGETLAPLRRGDRGSG